ncbi:MAG: hypothetical protein M3457_17650 [Chloroflexota bacterium]|nr:hypothetical protein [Chloroflexota bacterium]
MSDRVDALFGEIAIALRSVPGARALYAFGSIPNGTYDEFSDLDLTLVTEDFETSLAQRHQYLGRVRPVLLDWCIERTESSWAGTILLSGTSPYQKVDIGIVTMERELEWSHRPGCTRIWEQASGPGSIAGDGMPSQPGYEPAVGSFEHFIVGHLLGVTRYLKARRRGNTFTSWRFAHALAEAVLATVYTSSIDSPLLEGKLTTAEYVDLDRRLPGDRAAMYFEHLCYAGENGMDESVRFFVGELISGLTSTQDTGTALDLVVTTLDSFVTTELNYLRWKTSGCHCR